MTLLWDALFAFAIAAGGVGLTLLYARRAGLFDIPNHRSSHNVPTPRGGGLPLMISIGIVGAYAFRNAASISRPNLALLGGTLALLTVLGWIDDERSIGVRLRLAIHVACGIPVALLVNHLAPLDGLANVLWLALWIFWTAASINILNFMDGVDGMIATQAIVYGIFLYSLLPADIDVSGLGVIIAAACLGFLVWNWKPAKIFMGDTGSGPLGYLFTVAAALAVGTDHGVLVFLPLYPLYFDALATLVSRRRRGEKLTDAHRSHLYQRLANGGSGHSVVTLIYALAAAVGALLTIYLRDKSTALSFVAVAGYCLAVGLTWKIAGDNAESLSASISAQERAQR